MSPGTRLAALRDEPVRATIGAEAHLPFGGTKATGNGHREVGQAAIDFFSEWKSVFIDDSGKLQRAQIDMDFVDQEQV